MPEEQPQEPAPAQTPEDRPLVERDIEAEFGPLEPAPAPLPEPPRPPRKRWRGRFIARGLMLAAAVVVVGGAILWLQPPRQPRRPWRTSMEARPVDAMRAYVEAQYRFRKARRDSSGKSTFAKEMHQLQGLLPAELIAARGPAGKPYHGYLFLEMKSIEGQPIDWRADFAICAIPVEYRRTGYRTFIVGTDGFVVGKDRSDATFLGDYPDIFGADSWVLSSYVFVGVNSAGKYNRDARGRVIPWPTFPPARARP